MNCVDVKNRLPDYLSDKCSSDEKREISEHISICPHCMKALDELDEPIIKSENYGKALDTGTLLNKARKALILKVTTTTLLSIIILISIFFAIIPGILKAISYPKIPDLTRSLADITQFTSPSIVSGYGNSLAPFGNYSFNIQTYTFEMTGTKQKNASKVEKAFNMLTSTYESPVKPFTQFIHPNVKASDKLLEKLSPDKAKKTLTKNNESTTGVVDISLKSTISLSEVAAALKDLDVKVIWMAVECGSEDIKPNNMSNAKNQYVQWGIPRQLFNQDVSQYSEFDYSNPSKFENAVIEELKWLEKNKQYITADKSLIKSQSFDNSVGNKAKYVIENGLKIYGLRITGPSTELSKLSDKLNVRMEEVIDIDFYYWN